MSDPNNKSSITSSVDFTKPGRQIGDLRVRWSDNSVPLGYHPVPIISLKGGSGPTVLMTAGNHGDEFEGPSALMRLVRDIDPIHLKGQLLILPGLNAPAMQVSSRVSPLDGVNMNRAFPGDPQGGITAQIAHYVEQVLLPLSNAAIDLHSGGKASFFQPCTLATRTQDKTLFAKNQELADAFGLPLTWVLGNNNDHRSLNSAAERAGVPMIATELGGGGGVDPAITDATEAGLYAMLRHLGVLDGTRPDLKPTRHVEIKSMDHSLFAPGAGVFDRFISSGADVKVGQEAGWMHYPLEPRRPSEQIVFEHDGYVLAHTERGNVTRGDLLYLVVQGCDD